MTDWLEENRAATIDREMHVMQLLPADGWHAVYDGGGDGRLRSPLVAWALVVLLDGGTPRQAVVGLVGDGELTVMRADDVQNFRGYERQP